VPLPLGDGQRVLAPLSHPRVASEVLLRVRARARARVWARGRGRARARASVRVASTLLDAQAQLRLLVEEAAAERDELGRVRVVLGDLERRVADLLHEARARVRLRVRS